MPYPPPDHYLSDLAVRPSFEAGSSRVELEITPALCGPRGGALLGVLATAIDMAAGGLSRRHAAPDWVATSDLAIDLAAPVPPGACGIGCRLVRRGRSLVTMAIEVHAVTGADAPAPLLGVGTAAFAVLPDPGREQGSGARGDGREAVSGELEPVGARAGTRTALGLHDRLGIRVLEAASGEIEAPLDDYVRNTFGALQGGVVAVLCEAAMIAAAGRPLASLAVRYLALGRRGPFRATAEILHGTAGTDVARAELRDLGAEGALLAMATGRPIP